MGILEDLQAIGLTEYEAKVYVALLRDSPATGYQLSKQAGVPRSMVYEALGRLQARGAVLTTDESRATLYRPLPPDVLLNRYDQEQRRLTSSLREELSTLHTASDEDRIWSVTGRGSVLTYAMRMLDEARSEALLVLNDGDLDTLRDKIIAASARGVSISSLLTGLGELHCGRVARHPPQESALQHLMDDLVVVIDGQQALIANADQEMTATITRNRNLVLIARQFIWMELAVQRVYARLGSDLLANLDPEDRRIFEGFSTG